MLTKKNQNTSTCLKNPKNGNTISLKLRIRNFIFISFAAVIMALNIKIFVRNANTFPGGATGLTLLIQQIFWQFFNIKVSYTIINLLINAIPVYIGFRYIGKHFTILSVYMIIITSVLTDLLPAIKITDDILLLVVFGGIINGVAISICLLSGATSGGTDFISIFISERKGIDSFNIILGFNTVILTIAGFLFGWDKAMYSIVFQYISTQVLHLLYRKYQETTLFIVTNKPREVVETIATISGHSSTILEGEGSYEHCERNVVYSVISSQESSHVVKAVKTTDPKAFVNVMRTQQVQGRFYRPKEY
ncbi:YitT family protein [Lachnospira sp.]|uniref:YitT family protein n=1 Tax=Lachnospira sp. TaxID=2049031 RepID=UPI00257D7B91|nr:YitT family protein [Lachnospira sp.]